MGHSALAGRPWSVKSCPKLCVLNFWLSCYSVFETHTRDYLRKSSHSSQHNDFGRPFKPTMVYRSIVPNVRPPDTSHPSTRALHPPTRTHRLPFRTHLLPLRNHYLKSSPVCLRWTHSIRFWICLSYSIQIHSYSQMRVMAVVTSPVNPVMTNNLC
ncbi:hypothetical protein BDR03DRAFT_73990 [Suillus americanus]|nr:hypothetical protein BDR03DRAFT_73990 [Suillus americanus]